MSRFGSEPERGQHQDRAERSSILVNSTHGIFRMYDWIKALHVIAVIAWMAGMLYLPRLFVYHCEAEAGSKQSETFKVMERRVRKGGNHPAVGEGGLGGRFLP